MWARRGQLPADISSAELTARCTVPVDTYDERFTTALATASGGREGEDAVAAAHLLQGYLTRLAG